MSQPLSHPDLRRRNLSLLLGTLLRHEEATRKQVERESGLSKATVSRLTEELIQAGAVVSRTSAPVDPSARGRRAETLSTPASLGVVAGVSLGTRTTSVFVADLTGRELAWHQVRTPTWTSFEDAVAWAVETTRQAVEPLSVPLRRVVVAVPSRTLDGASITRPPLFMSVIEGDGFARALAEQLGCAIRVELDAAMVLVGLEHLGFIDRTTHPVLLNASSVITMSLRRRDGSMVEGLTPSFGDFDLIPIDTQLGRSTLGSLLGARGLFEHSEQLGQPLGAMEDLWETESAEITRLRDAFRAALTQAIRIIAVTTDPRLIIFTGRLSPLVSMTLPAVEDELSRELVEPPALRVVGHTANDYPAAVGAAHEARAGAVVDLLDRVTSTGLDALH